jgi:hypothetical protein
MPEDLITFHPAYGEVTATTLPDGLSEELRTAVEVRAMSGARHMLELLEIEEPGNIGLESVMYDVANNPSKVERKRTVLRAYRV